MNKKRGLILTEEDKKYILSLYGVLKEQVVASTQPTTPAQGTRSLTIQSNVFFDDGMWRTLSPVGQRELETKLAELQNFIIQNPNSIIRVKIIGGESQVPNKDNEVNPPVAVAQGYLSRKRAETLTNRLNEFFQTQLNDGNLQTMPEFLEPDFVIGQTPYPGGSQQQYDAERFMKAKIDLLAPYECLVNLRIDVLYNETPDSNFPCRGKHQCDKAKFDLLANGVTLGEVNLNNKIDGRSRSSSFTITNEQAQQIMASSQSQRVVLSIKCKSNDCHTSTPEVRLSKGNRLLFHRCTAPFAQRGGNEPIQILTFDACGNVVQQGNPQLMNVTSEIKRIKTIPSRFYDNNTYNIQNYLKKEPGTDYYIVKDNYRIPDGSGFLRKNDRVTLFARNTFEFYD